MINFFVRRKLLFSILFYILWGYGFFAQFLNLRGDTYEVLKWTSIILLFIFWLIVVADMLNHQFKHRFFWILSMFILPFFAPVVYLFQRRRLLHLHANKFRNN